MRPKDIKYDAIASYLARRLEEKAAAATVRYELMLLRRMFVLAIKTELVGRMPSFPRLALGDNARTGFCTPEEIERVIERLPEHVKPVVRALYLTGWRSGEVVGLTWSRIDFEAGAIRLDAAQSKSGKPRTIPFGQVPALVALLKAQRQYTTRVEHQRCRVVAAVFHRDGEPLGSFRSAWRTAVKNAGLPGLRPHDLSRSCARNLVRAGVSESVVMRLLGWQTAHMFRRYNITDTRDLAEGVERLGSFLKARSRRLSAARSRAQRSRAAER